MNAFDRKIAADIASLRKQVEAAQQEFDMAVRFHETWKPLAYDKDLHNRMGDSFATHTFLVVRLALRREMLLALMRLWDRDGRNVGMEFSIADLLRDQAVVHALAADRAVRIGMADEEDQMRSDLSQRASEAIALVEKYSETGSHYATLRKLRDCGTNISRIGPLKKWWQPDSIPPMWRLSPLSRQFQANRLASKPCRRDCLRPK